MRLFLLFLLAGLLSFASRADEPFRKHRYDLFQTLAPREGSIVFVGNSITDMHPWVEAFRTSDGNVLPIVNRGNSGTYSTEQADNLESYLSTPPKKLFLMIGTNDIATSGGLNLLPDQVTAYVKSIVERIHKRCPATKIYLYSILKNHTANRPAERWLQTNEKVKAYVEETGASWLTYIDLYEALSAVADGGVWSYDKLHLTAAAYQIWCKEICRYLQEDEDFTVSTVYPDDAQSTQQDGGLTGSNGMRATYFSLLPVAADDVLFFGDEEVKNGEWNELLGNTHVKNRGTGWGYGGCDIAGTVKLVDATFAETGVEKACPKAVLIYTGTTDVNGSTDIETVKSNYKALIDRVIEKAASAKIYLLGVHPTANATINTERIAVLNAYLASLPGTEGYGQVRYIDSYTPLLNGAVAHTDYIRNTNYLYGMGYHKIAGLIRDALAADFPDDSYNVRSDAEVTEIYTQAANRNVVGQALTQGMVAPIGDGTGQYSATGMEAFQLQAEEAYNLLAQSSLTTAEATAMSTELTRHMLEALNLPKASSDEEEHWYQLHSLRLNDYYVTAQGEAVGVVGDNTASTFARSMWKFVPRDDQSFDIVNRKYEAYLSPSATYNTQINTTTTRPTAGWTISYGNTPGYYILSSGEVELNQTQAGLGYKIYNWSATATKGSDRSDAGCQFLITEAPEMEDEEVEEATFTLDKTNGTLYNSSNGTTGNYFCSWKSAQAPQLVFDCGTVNNINWSGNNLQLYTGSAQRATYTLRAPAGYIIDSYSFTFANNGHSTGLSWTMADGTAYTTSTAPTACSASEVGLHNLSFTLAGANGNGVVLTDFTVHIKLDRPEPPRISTAGDEHWYYITNASTKAYCADKVMYYDATNDRMRFGDKHFQTEYIWSFWEQDGKVSIKNYRGEYIGTAGSGTGGSTQFGKSDTPNYIYSINEAYGFFIIKDNATELHAQEAGAVIVRWAAAEDGASLWRFEPVDVSNPEVTVGSTSVKQGKVTTGIGNKNQPIVRATFNVDGLTGQAVISAIKGKVVATDPTDIRAVKAFMATNDRELFVDEDQAMTWRETNGVLFGQAEHVGDDGSFTINGIAELAPGTHHLWIAYDIAESATEGHTVDAVITGYTVNGEELAEANGNPSHAVTIFLSEGAVLMPYDCGSRYYRIPAITTVKKQRPDGTTVDRLVALTDDRLQHNGDLPNQVYVVAQYSDDLGKTWTRPVRVAGTAELGGAYGHGDASIVTDRRNGNIIGIMTSAGSYGKGFWSSTAEQPMLWKTITSTDGGETWSAPTDHTKSLYGVDSPNPTWKGGFSGSGAALQKRDGTLVSSFVNRDANDVRNFHFFMSKDGGTTWYVSGTSGTTNADEPKTLERNNGDLSIFVRAGGYNYHNVTSDDGATWQYAPETRFTSGISGTACDGEYMTWCSTLDGNPWNIALETLPNSGSRENVSICLSTDEGETFGTPKTICPWSSGYSTAVVLPDGTLGVYYEEDGYYNSWNYVMRFVRFSLDWASNGTYRFTAEQPFRPIGYNDDDVALRPVAADVCDTATYDLQGRRVSAVRAPGVYIQGGRKKLIK